MRIAFFLLGLALLMADASAQRSGLDLSSLDRSVRPQDDLYGFANGGWLRRAKIPAERVTYGTFTELEDRADLAVRAIVERIEPRGMAERQVRDLYNSIVDESAIERLGMTPMRAQLLRIDGIRSASALAREMGRLSAIGTSGPFVAAPGLAPGHPPAVVITVREGGTLLPGREYYLGADPDTVRNRAAYLQYLTHIFTLAGRPGAAADAQRVLELETVLAQHQQPLAASRTQTRERAYTLERLRHEIPGFDWLAWAEPQGFDRAAAFVLRSPEFFAAFGQQIRATPLETWKALLAARYITATSIYVSRPFADARFDFFGRVLTGQEAPRERWRRGVSLVNTYLGDTVGRLYVRDHFPATSRPHVRELARQIIVAFREAVDEADWLSPDARRMARRKLEHLRVRVGHPDEWRTYAGLQIRAGDLVGNVERAERFENAFRLARLGGSGADGHWTVTPQSINAYYTPALNEIVLPAAILQPPLFDPEAEDAVNYGGIGALIAHEIGHALDLRGRYFDHNGGLSDWWTADDVNRFETRARALVEQFNGYSPIPGAFVNGESTLAENVGDIGGLAVALRAYRASLRGGAAPVLDGFTGEQRLLIRWAQMWRAKMRDDYVRHMLLLERHAPPRFRAHGAVVHLDAFHEAFGVQPGDALYRPPSGRVRIW